MTKMTAKAASEHRAQPHRADEQWRLRLAPTRSTQDEAPAGILEVGGEGERDQRQNGERDECAVWR
jgi:hypothetical protein